MRRLFAAGVIVVGAATAARAQDSALPSSPRAMDLRVVATGPDGAPRLGLTDEDFVLRVDGSELAYDYFAEERNGAISQESLESLSPDLVYKSDSGIHANVIPRHILIVLDLERGDAHARAAALAGARAIARGLRSADNAALFAVGRPPVLLVDWTSDRAALLAGLSKYARGRPTGRDFVAEEERLAASLARHRPSPALLGRLRRWADESVRDTTRRLDDVSQALSLFSGRLGARAMYLVSDGFETQPAARLFTRFTGSRPAAPLPDASGPLQILTDGANGEEVTIYSAGVPVSRAARSRAGAAPLWAGLFRMAEETGGVFNEGANGSAASASALEEDMQFGYWIGVDLENLRPDVRHRIEVEPTRAGVRTRCRTSYTPPTPEELLERRLSAALLTGASFADLAARAVAGAPERGPGGAMRVPIRVTVPAGDVRFVPSSDGASSARLEYYVTAVAEDGSREPFLRAAATFNYGGSPQPSALLRAGLTLPLKPGRYEIVVNVRDAATGRLGTSRLEARVPAPEVRPPGKTGAVSAAPPPRSGGRVRR